MTAPTFKPGDRVRVVKASYAPLIGQSGTVVQIDTAGYHGVRLDSDQRGMPLLQARAHDIAHLDTEAVA